MFTKVNTDYQDKQGRDICGCCRSYYVVSLEEAEANQAMYEALEKLEYAFMHQGSITGNEYRMAVINANKALAKADGK